MQVDLDLDNTSSLGSSSEGRFQGNLENLLALVRYQSKGHGNRELCASLSLLEQQFYFSLSTLEKVELSMKRDEKSGLCLIERKSEKNKKSDFSVYADHTLLSSFLLGLNLLSVQYKNDIFVKVGGQCHQKKVKVPQTTTEIAGRNI